ncbi:TPA_asm: nucleocapsid protein [Aconitum virus 1]|uniref:Nucleoprotein n=1 Tax=Aconitum virus 1 TaxID=2977949 RepID=A0A9N6YIV4_9RHAB|nr:TPA_asm: nucleocapsid protein [Aconitum virus 1]
MDVEELAKRVRDFNIRNAMITEPKVAEVVNTPLGIERAPLGNDYIQEKINKFLSAVPEIKGIDDRFIGVPDVSESMKAVTTEFEDSKFLTEKSLVLEEMKDEEIVILGREVIPMLSFGFSQWGVGAIFRLAFQLRDPTNARVFSVDDASGLEDEDGADLSPILMSSSPHPGKLPGITVPADEAKAYSYIAASTLRLFTKSEENYVKSWTHTLGGYQRFYGQKFPVPLALPSQEAIKTLSHYFSHEPMFKMTLYRLLYSGGGAARAPGLRNFLYEIHLVNTGIHIVSIFVRLCSILNCTPGLLLTAMNAHEFSRQITTMVSMITLITRSDEDHKRKMWRFGRIFDDTFMSPLQTKACPLLAYTLASALKGESAQSSRDILNIAQFSEISPEKRRLCAASGEMIVKIIRKYNAQGGTGLAFKIMAE